MKHCSSWTHTRSLLGRHGHARDGAVPVALDVREDARVAEDEAARGHGRVPAGAVAEGADRAVLRQINIIIIMCIIIVIIIAVIVMIIIIIIVCLLTLLVSLLSIALLSLSLLSLSLFYQFHHCHYYHHYY